MSRKRPSIFETLDLTGEEAPAAPPGAELPASNVVPIQAVEPAAAPVVAPQRTAAKPKERSEVHHTSIYVPKAAYRKIREIANTEDRKPHDVIMQGIDMVLAKYGFPSLAEYKRGKKR
jgi:hypothetical protein